MAGPNLDLIEFFLVIFFLNLNKHAKNENGQVENSQKKNMFENDNKKDTFDEGCEDKPDDDSSFKFQQKSNTIPTTLEENEQPEMVPATFNVSGLDETRGNLKRLAGVANLVRCSLVGRAASHTAQT